MSEELVEEFITVESIFVRGRNCLALRSKFSPLFTDYFLPLMQYGLRNEEVYDRQLSSSGRLPSPTSLSPVLP